VLASRVGGLPELIDDGYSGMLLPPGKGGEWIAAAKQIMDERTRSRLAVGAHEAWRANLSPDIGIANLSSAYEEALSRVVGV
jgi:glycosyltransferase involved in cell wall biosynthesis